MASGSDGCVDSGFERASVRSTLGVSYSVISRIILFKVGSTPFSVVLGVSVSAVQVSGLALVSRAEEEKALGVMKARERRVIGG